jgi:ribonuclease HII
MNLICGVDEAGRGPVLGPLVMAGVLIDEKNESILKNLGVKDSKLLTKGKRDELFKKIITLVKGYEIISITASEIDDALLSETMNLNILEAYKTADILNKLNPDKAIIDLPEKNQERYQGYIRKKLKNKEMNLITEHKADFNYPSVAAASILAKVTRDRYIDFLKEQIGIDFGSGYMTDEKTTKFLEKHWNNSKVNFFRKQWASWKNMKLKKEQKNLFDY